MQFGSQTEVTDGYPRSCRCCVQCERGSPLSTLQRNANIGYNLLAVVAIDREQHLKSFRDSASLPLCTAMMYVIFLSRRLHGYHIFTL